MLLPTLAENKYPKPSYSKCFPQTAHGPLTSQTFFPPANSQVSKLSRQFMEKKVLIIYKLSFSEPTFFPKLEQLLKNGSFEILCLPTYTQYLCYEWWEEEVYGETGPSGSYEVEKLPRRGRKSLQFEICVVSN